MKNSFDRNAAVRKMEAKFTLDNLILPPNLLEASGAELSIAFAIPNM